MNIENLKKWIYQVLTEESPAFASNFADDDATNPGAFNVFYLENSKEDFNYPYLVYNFVGGLPSRDSLTRYDEPILQLTIFSNTSSSLEVSQLGDMLDKIFDDHEASETETEFILGIERIVFPREKRSISKTWSWSADYKFNLQNKGV